MVSRHCIQNVTTPIHEADEIGRVSWSACWRVEATPPPHGALPSHTIGLRWRSGVPEGAFPQVFSRATSSTPPLSPLPGGRRRQPTAAAACGLDAPLSTPSDPPVIMSAAMPAAAVAAARVAAAANSSRHRCVSGAEWSPVTMWRRPRTGCSRRPRRDSCIPTYSLLAPPPRSRALVPPRVRVEERGLWASLWVCMLKLLTVQIDCDTNSLERPHTARKDG